MRVLWRSRDRILGAVSSILARGSSLEATAALANLASGGATRRRCEDLDCETVPLLLR